MLTRFFKAQMNGLRVSRTANVDVQAKRLAESGWPCGGHVGLRLAIENPYDPGLPGHLRHARL